MRWRDQQLRWWDRALPGASRTIFDVTGSEEWVQWTLITVLPNSTIYHFTIPCVFPYHPTRFNQGFLHFLCFEFISEVPLSWVDVPLWHFGDDGWEEKPQCLASMLKHMFVLSWQSCSPINPIMSLGIPRRSQTVFEAYALHLARDVDPMADLAGHISIYPRPENSQILDAHAGCAVGCCCNLPKCWPPSFVDLGWCSQLREWSECYSDLHGIGSWWWDGLHQDMLPHHLVQRRNLYQFRKFCHYDPQTNHRLLELKVIDGYCVFIRIVWEMPAQLIDLICDEQH